MASRDDSDATPLPAIEIGFLRQSAGGRKLLREMGRKNRRSVRGKAE